VTHWAGEDLSNKSIVVYQEEGVGDFFHFCRFIPALYERGARSVQLTGTQPDVLELVADNIRVDGIVPVAGPFDCDFVTGSMSVPWRCGVGLEQINGRPYFTAEPATFPLRGRLNVGLVWRGNPKYQRDHDRSMALETLAPLFELPGVAFYALQFGDGRREITELGLDGFIADLTPRARSWRATAALIRRLDAIVCVDTAVGHLAGALGVPVFILITNACDWRWERNSVSSRWYDSATVLRQQHQGDWTACVYAARTYLEEWFDGRRQTARADTAGAARLHAAQ
jgi:hypothetical protein